MSHPELQTISPCFIVTHVEPTIAFYRDKFGFEVRCLEPEEGPYFAIIGRDGAQIFIKAKREYLRSPTTRDIIACASTPSYIFSFEKILLPVLKSHSKFQSAKTKVSAEKTAHILSGAVRGFKVVAKDAPEIRSLIKELLILLLDD